MLYNSLVSKQTFRKELYSANTLIVYVFRNFTTSTWRAGVVLLGEFDWTPISGHSGSIGYHLLSHILGLSFLVSHDTFPASIWPGNLKVSALDPWSLHCSPAAWPSSCPMALTTTHLLKTQSSWGLCLHPDLSPPELLLPPGPQTYHKPNRIHHPHFLISLSPLLLLFLQPNQWHQCQLKMPVQECR